MTLEKAEELFEKIMEAARFEADWDSEFHLPPETGKWGYRRELAGLGQDALPVLEKAVLGRDPLARTEGLYALEMMGPSAGRRGIEILLALLSKGLSRWDLNRAAVALACISLSDAVKAGLHTSPGSRKAVLEMLRERGSEEDLEIIDRLLTHRHATVKEDTVRELLKSPSLLARFEGRLLEALRERKQSLRQAAMHGLCDLGNEHARTAVLEAAVGDPAMLYPKAAAFIAPHPRSAELLAPVAGHMARRRLKEQELERLLEAVAQVAQAQWEMHKALECPRSLVETVRKNLRERAGANPYDWSTHRLTAAVKAAGGLRDSRLLDDLMYVLHTRPASDPMVLSALAEAFHAFGAPARSRLEAEAEAEGTDEDTRHRIEHIIRHLDWLG